MSTGPNSSFGSVKRVSKYSKYFASISFENMSIIADLAVPGGPTITMCSPAIAGDGHQADDFLLVEELRAHLAREVLERRTDARDIDGKAARSRGRSDHSKPSHYPKTSDPVTPRQFASQPPSAGRRRRLRWQ